MSSETRVRQNGAVIRALRVNLGLSVPYVADRIGLHQQALRNIENESRPASLVIINRIARMFRVTPDVITRDQPNGGNGEAAA